MRLILFFQGVGVNAIEMLLLHTDILCIVNKLLKYILDSYATISSGYFPNWTGLKST